MGHTAIDWLHDWDEAFVAAKKSDRLILIDVEKED